MVKPTLVLKILINIDKQPDIVEIKYKIGIITNNVSNLKRIVNLLGSSKDTQNIRNEM